MPMKRLIVPGEPGPLALLAVLFARTSPFDLKAVAHVR